MLLSIRRGGCRGDSSVGGEEEGLGSQAVGAVGVDVGGGQAVVDEWTGGAEGVVLAVADDGVDGRDGGEEVWSGGGMAAVMAYLEQRGVLEAVVGQHGLLAWGFGVAFEENAGAVVGEAED